MNLTDPMHPGPVQSPFQLRAARNEWTSVTVQVVGVKASDGLGVRVTGKGPFERANLSGFQVLPVPVEVNPDYVRLTGMSAVGRSIPRALLPAAGADSTIRLANLRNPSRPTDASAHPDGSPLLLWIDVHVPQDTPAGDYPASVELIDREGRVVSSAAVKLTVFDFALPAERHLQICGELNWERLSGLYPTEFAETVSPNLMNRRDPRFGKTVAKLDQLVQLAQQNRVVATVSALRPTVKWPADGAPEIDWRDFDAVVTPWLNGTQFPDKAPLGYWPLPVPANFERHETKARVDYWTLAALHFEQLGWLDRTAADLPKAVRAEVTKDVEGEAAKVLAANARVRVTLPLQDTELTTSPPIVPEQELSRVLTEAPGLISTVRPPGIGAEVRRRSHWLSGRDAGATCDERDVRAWAWLAFLRQAEIVDWDSPLPENRNATEKHDANALAWFYPGSWFGVDQPVPTLQLKWMRRSEQDFEYLWLARDRGELISALQMSRLITKPVEVMPDQRADPAFSLMSGTPSQEAWDRAQELLAESILLRRPGEPADENKQRAIYIKTLQWAESQERPLLISRGAKWAVAPESGRSDIAPQRRLINLAFGLDVYNASDTTPNKNMLRWDAPPPASGWQLALRKGVEVPRLQTYHVEPATISAGIDLDRIGPTTLNPLELTFVNGYSDASYPYEVRLPVAPIDRRDTPMLINARLDDWSESDSINDGPLVLMMNRPNLQKARLEPAQVSSKIYGCWSREAFYLAFALEGLSTSGGAAHNDVYYQSRRAWGEDLAEAVIQAVFPDNSLGPVLHVVFKPGGALWLERKNAGGWESVEGSGLRYAALANGDGRWRGEASVPWKLLGTDGKGLPTLLRFNFSQHRNLTCESASWCGPVDFGRDDQLMGVLYVREFGSRR